MLFGFFIKTLAVFTAAALLIYGITSSASLGYLAKLVAIDLGLSIITLVVYPHFRGIKKGDRIIVSDEKTLLLLFGFTNGIAITDGRINDFVQFELIDGTTGIGKVSRYEGFLTSAEIKVMEKNVKIEITQ